ncbi:MAG: hypothetical protein ACRYFS_25930 [Janthinobacterium lividum]
MSEIPGRLFRIAKTYLDAAKDRLDEIDSRAQEELTKALNRDDIKSGLSGSDDPMARAQAKINAARGEAPARQEAAPVSQTALGKTDPIQTAYKIIGISAGSDYLTVQTAVNKLRERCAPSRFPNGSVEQSESQMILSKVEEAYQVLQNALDPGAGRFDKLEL